MMKKMTIGPTALEATRLAYGCWRLAEGSGEGASGRAAVVAAYEAGYTLFDLADIYGDGECERIFGAVLRELPEMRDRIVVATKCGIRKPGDPAPEAPYRYDFSRDYILRSCEGSLERMGGGNVDLFLLHRPDWLCDPEEVAAAFNQLEQEGKVRQFGVSNFSPSQVDLVQSALELPLVANQVEISLANLAAFADGTLDQCIARNITPMAWSPLGGGKLGDGEHKVLGHQEGYRTSEIASALDAMGKALGASRSNVALAWLLRHPAGIMPIVGSTNPGRIREAVKAGALELTREQWYTLLEAARGRPLP